MHLFHIQLSLSNVILMCKKYAVTYTSHPITDQQSGRSHIRKQSLLDHRISLFVISVPCGRMKIAIIQLAHHPTLMETREIYMAS